MGGCCSSPDDEDIKSPLLRNAQSDGLDQAPRQQTLISRQFSTAHLLAQPPSPVVQRQVDAILEPSVPLDDSDATDIPDASSPGAVVPVDIDPVVDNELEERKEREEKMLKACLYTQARWRGRAAQRKYRSIRKRFFVVRELAETEKSYVSALDVLVEVFLKPLRANQALISEADLKVVSSCIETIIPFQKTFADAISTNVDRWNVDSRIGDQLIDLTKFIRIYTEYINNYDMASELVLRIQNQPSLKAFLEKCYSNPVTHMVGDFLSYLILPIQRIPRYRMLLESIIAATPQTHPDYQLLTEALSKISEIATYINERKRQQERGREVMRVYKAIFPTIDDLIQPGRQLLLEGPLHDALADEVEQYWFLFDDLMLMTKEARKGEKYKLKGRASVRDLIFIPIDEIMNESDRLTRQVPTHAFAARVAGVGRVFYSESPTESARWKKALESASEELHKKLASFPNSAEAKAAEVKDIVVKHYSGSGTNTPTDTPPGSPGVRRFAARKSEWQKFSKPGSRQSGQLHPATEEK